MAMAPSGRKHAGNLTQQVVAHISSLIESGALAPGEKLPPESEIVRQEGVSRTVVGEAISKLQALGLVETRHGIGTFIREHEERREFGMEWSAINTADDIWAMLEVRIGIETEAATLAAMRRTNDHLEAMRLAMESFRKDVRTGVQRQSLTSNFIWESPEQPAIHTFWTSSGPSDRRLFHARDCRSISSSRGNRNT